MWDKAGISPISLATARTHAERTAETAGRPEASDVRNPPKYRPLLRSLQETRLTAARHWLIDELPVTWFCGLICPGCAKHRSGVRSWGVMIMLDRGPFFQEAA